MSGPDYFVHRLTWPGHEFLAATRDETVWKRVTERVLKGGASWTFDIVKEWAKHEFKTRLGLPGVTNRKSPQREVSRNDRA